MLIKFLGFLVLLLVVCTCRQRVNGSNPEDVFNKEKAKKDEKDRGYLLRVDKKILYYIPCNNYEPDQAQFSFEQCDGLTNPDPKNPIKKSDAIKVFKPVIRDRCDYVANAKVEEWKGWLELAANQETADFIKSINSSDPALSDEQKNQLIQEKIKTWPDFKTLSKIQSQRLAAGIKILQELKKQKTIFNIPARKENEEDLDQTTIQNDALDEFKSKISIIVDAEKDGKDISEWQSLKPTMKYENRAERAVGDLVFQNCLGRFRVETEFESL